ncbi:MAG: glycoside hydrolase family 15 protein, partial [Planctomycetota bacterium]
MSGFEGVGPQKAFGAPGIEPRWTSSNKEAVGTAYSTSSRVWFTCSHGVLNEIYYPTIDRPQVRDMQFLITDGETFIHEEKRDLESEIGCTDEHSLGWQIVNRDPDGRYTLEKVIITDPYQSCVLLHCRIRRSKGFRKSLKVYVLLAPHLEGGGAGNSASRYTVAGREILIAWKNDTYLALGADVGFAETSCGFVGHSDGWQDLRNNLTMGWHFERAENGNVACTARVDTSSGYQFTVGIAFGEGRHAAVTQLVQSLSADFAELKRRYARQWHRVCGKTLDIDKIAGDEGRLFRTSHKLLLAHEDKTFAGAIIASASIPWGQSKGDEDLGGYHLVWTRDLVNSAMGLLAAGDKVTPRRALVYLACSQRPDGSFPQNFWIDGTPYWSGIQLDEVAFP